jgi:predicted flap endonuclease-1-like 5' DNA nuclease
MSSSLFSILAQLNTGSDWNWFLIFIVFVIILAVALIIQAMFSKEEAAELEHHEETVHDAAEEVAVDETSSQPEPEEEPEAAVEADEPELAPEAPAEPDDLKILEGVGPKVAAILNENGITTFAQLADTSVEKLDQILDANNLHMLHPGSWPQQARLAADGDWEAFEKLTEELHGGRAR